MAKKLVWQHKLHQLSSRLGFRWVDKTLAETLITDGAAQRTEIGAHRFKYLDRSPIPAPVVAKSKSKQADVPAEG